MIDSNTTPIISYINQSYPSYPLCTISIISSLMASTSTDSIPLLYGENKQKVHRTCFSLYNIHKNLMTILIFCQLFLTYILPFINLAFYPSFSATKGLSTSEVGFSMGVFAYGCTIISVPLSLIVKPLDSRFTLLLFGVLSGGTAILYGQLEFMSRLPYEMYSIIFHIIQAICCIGASIATYRILWVFYPKSRYLVVSFTEMITKLGNLTGPVLGGVLYDLIGFCNIYLLFGIISIILAILLHVSICNFTIQAGRLEEKNLKMRDLLKLFKSPLIPILLIAIGLDGASYYYFDPVLGPYLKQRYGVSSTVVGFVRLPGDLVILIILPVLGPILDRINLEKLFIPFGIILSAVGAFLYPPSSLFFSKDENFLYLTFISNGILGTGQVITYIFSVSYILKICEKQLGNLNGIEGIIISIFLASYYFGEGSGKLIAGIIADECYLDETVVYNMALLIVWCVVFIFIVIKYDKDTPIFLEKTLIFYN